MDFASVVDVDWRDVRGHPEVAQRLSQTAAGDTVTLICISLMAFKEMASLLERAAERGVAIDFIDVDAEACYQNPTGARWLRAFAPGIPDVQSLASTILAARVDMQNPLHVARNRGRLQGPVRFLSTSIPPTQKGMFIRSGRAASLALISPYALHKEAHERDWGFLLVEGSSPTGDAILRQYLSAAEALAEGIVSGMAEIASETPPIFVSFALKDQALAENGCERLRDRGLETFLSSEMLRYGEGLHERLRNALTGCRMGIQLLTPHALRKEWMYSEAAALWVLNKPIVAALTGTHDLEGMPFYAKSSVYCDRLDDEATFARLCDHVELVYRKLGGRLTDTTQRGDIRDAAPDRPLP